MLPENRRYATVRACVLDGNAAGNAGEPAEGRLGVAQLEHGRPAAIARGDGCLFATKGGRRGIGRDLLGGGADRRDVYSEGNSGDVLGKDGARDGQGDQGGSA